MDNFFTGNKTSSNYSRTYSKGKSFKFSVWNSKDTYNNDEFVQDFVQYDKTLWAAKKTSTNIIPTDGEYWELIVKGVSDIEFRQVDNRIEYRYIDPTSEWKDLFELASVSEDQIKKMLEDLDIKYGNTYDVKLSETSTNAIQNQAVTKKFKELDEKNTRTDKELTNIKSSVNTALSNSKLYTDSRISETKTQIDSELSKKINQTDVEEIVDVLNENINLKVDKVSGKGLSTNDFNDNYKSKLDNLDSSLNNTLTSAKSHTNSEITKIDNKINSEISRAQTSETNLSDRINDLEEDLVDALKETKEYTDSLANGEVKNNTNKINTLNGTGEGSVIKTVKDEISNLVGTAPKKLDTLQEIADYLEEHEDMASGLVNSLSELEAKKADKTALNNLKTETDSALQSLDKIKANTTGYYPQLHVGLSDNLPDRGDVTEGLIGFRESAGAGNSIEDGTANVQELLGESLVWNQLVDHTANSRGMNGITFTKNADNSYTVSGQLLSGEAYMFISSGFAQRSGGKYLIINDSDGSVFLGGYNIAGLSPVSAPTILTATTSGEQKIALYVPTGTTGQINTVIRPRVIDLTQMFGAGKEPSTIEEFEAIKNQLVGVDFNAYNEGEVLGVNIKGIKSVNDNAFNGEYAKVLGGREYCADGTITSMGFTREIGGTTEAIVLDGENKFIPSENGYVYASGTDICIHLVHTGYKDHVYTEHEVSESSFDLTPYFPNGMHGIGAVRDSVTPKKATRRYGVVDMGALNWERYEAASGVFVYYTKQPLNDAHYELYGGTLLSSRYAERIVSAASFNDRDIRLFSNLSVYVRDDAYTDVASFKAMLQEKQVKLIYELATPIETEIDPQLNMNYKVWDFGTEELLTDSKSAPVLARTIYGFNATDTIRGNKAKNEEQDVRLQTLENEVVRVGDYQPDLSVGVADQLAGQDEPTPSEINFRKSGGGAILDGNARIEAIKGNSVVWNQLAHSFDENHWRNNNTNYHDLSFDNGVAIATAKDVEIPYNYSWSIASRGEICAFYANHKYLIALDYYESVALKGTLYLYAAGNNTIFTYTHTNDWQTLSQIYTPSTNSMAEYLLLYPEVVPYTNYNGEVWKSRNFRIIDLTKMFGVGNEPTTIEEFYARKPIVEDEYAYNEGEVIHMDVQSIESVGVNQWDEEWELGAFNADGSPTATSAGIRSKNIFHVVGGDQYYIYGETKAENLYAWFYFYDRDMNLIGRKAAYLPSSTNNADYDNPVTAPTNAAFAKLYVSQTYGTTYNHDICINLSDASINGKYFPYAKRMQSLDIIRKYFPDGMKSAGTAHDEIRYNKATQKWEAVQRIAKVDMGTLSWGTVNTDILPNSFHAKIADIITPSTSADYLDGLLCTRYGMSTKPGIVDIDDMSMLRYNGYVYVKDTSCANLSELNSALQDVMLYYELAEPIVTELDKEDQLRNFDYQVWNCGTEQAIANVPSTPLKADIVYGFNAYGTIKQLKEQMATLMTQMAQMQTQISSMGG